MGMFSWNCKACGFSLRECRNCSQDNWMGQAVILTRGGTRAIGDYDGYGRAGGWDHAESTGEEPCVYHKACWELVGKPEYTSPSMYAHDQGFCLVNHGTPMPKPTMEWLRQTAPMWHALDRVFDVWGDIKHELELNEETRKFSLLPLGSKLELLEVYKNTVLKLKQFNHDRMEAYYNDLDLDAIEPERIKPAETFYWGTLGFNNELLATVLFRFQKDIGIQDISWF